MSDRPWDDPDRLRELYVEQGLSSREVAEELGCSNTPILDRLDKFGIEKRPSQRDQTPEELEDGEKLRELYVSEGLTQQEIADRLECSRSTVVKHFQKHDVRSRTATPPALEHPEALRYLYCDLGMDTYQIASVAGCRASTVSEALSKHGIQARPRQEPAASELTDSEWLRREYVSKRRSTNDIAEELGCRATNISYWLKKHGIESRRRQQPATPELEDRELMERLYVEQRKTQREIADELGCRNENVNYWLQKHGIEGRDGTATENTEQLRDAELLRELYTEKKKSTIEIGDRLGCGSSTVAVWLDRHGIGLRPASPAGQDSPHWGGGKSIYDAVKKTLPLSWRVQRRKQRECDAHTCQLCGERRSAAEQSLDVNHIIPILCGGTNGFYNLMSMCRGCHRKAETFVGEYTSRVLVDWSDEELPEGRERWTPDAEPPGQAELAAFTDD